MSEQEAVIETEHQDLEETVQENDSPTASDSGENHEEKVEFNEAQQKVVNDIAAKKAFEVREGKRANEDLQRQLSELQAKMPVEQAPNIPEMPDQYDEDFDTKMAQRDEALKASERFDARTDFQQQQVQFQEQQRQQVQLEEQNKLVGEYSDRAQKLGVTDTELKVAGNIVAQYGINDQVTAHILNDDNGPLITKYLSQNPQAMDIIRNSPPISAALYIESQIKPQAIKLKPQTTNAPEPVDTLQGSGVSPSQGGPPGTIYE